MLRLDMSCFAPRITTAKARELRNWRMGKTDGDDDID